MFLPLLHTPRLRIVDSFLLLLFLELILDSIRKRQEVSDYVSKVHLERERERR